MWVTSEADGAVFVADLAAKKIVKPVKVGPRPRSIAFTPDGARAYVPSENGATLTEIDVKKLAPTKTIDLGKGMRPMGLRLSADGNFLYVILVRECTKPPARILDEIALYSNDLLAARVRLPGQTQFVP